MDGWNFRVVWKKKREAIYIYPPLFRFNHLEICIVKDVTFIEQQHSSRIFFRTN